MRCWSTRTNHAFWHNTDGRPGDALLVNTNASGCARAEGYNARAHSAYKGMAKAIRRTRGLEGNPFVLQGSGSSTTATTTTHHTQPHPGLVAEAGQQHQQHQHQHQHQQHQHQQQQQHQHQVGARLVSAAMGVDAASRREDQQRVLPAAMQYRRLQTKQASSTLNP
jgi:hypothetical protein